MAGLGIYHYQARFYSPKLGRFLSADTIVPNYTNPQGLNRFSYVINNPLLYVDPTGHAYCDYIDNNNAEDCGGGLANSQSSDVIWGSGNRGGNGGNNDQPREPGGTPPAPSSGGGACGQAGYYSSHCAGWHFYRTTNIVCPAYLNCTAAQMQDYLYRFVYPGQDPNDPVRNGDVNLVWVGIMPLGQIQTQVNGLMITNVTQRNHLMYDGQVERRAVQNSNGSWSIVTTGMGNNVQIPFVPAGPSGSAYQQMQNANFSALNQDLGPGAFNDFDEAMLNYILEHQ